MRADDVTFVAADFEGDDVAASLVAAGLDPTRPTCLLLEGVAPYLAVEVLARLVANVRTIAAPGSRLALSVGVARDPDDVEAAARAASFAATVATLGEPVRSSLGPAAATALLEAAGWQLDDDAACSGPVSPRPRAARRRARLARRPWRQLEGRRGQPVRGQLEPLVGLHHRHAHVASRGLAVELPGAHEEARGLGERGAIAQPSSTPSCSAQR